MSSGDEELEVEAQEFESRDEQYNIDVLEFLILCHFYYIYNLFILETTKLIIIIKYDCPFNFVYFSIFTSYIVF